MRKSPKVPSGPIGSVGLVQMVSPESPKKSPTPSLYRLGGTLGLPGTRTAKIGLFFGVSSNRSHGGMGSTSSRQELTP